MPALLFDGRHAYANGYHPLFVHHIVYHANALAHLPYKVGGGHRDLVDKGYDCSGSISYGHLWIGVLFVEPPSGPKNDTFRPPRSAF